MRIRITRGIYGFMKNGNVVEKTKDDPPFEVDDDEGRRLVALSVAEAVSAAGEKADSTTDHVMTETEDDGSVSGSFSVEELGNMSKEELCRLAETLGVKKNGSKTELAERIFQYVQTRGDDDPIEADDVPFEMDEVPELTAEDPV